MKVIERLPYIKFKKIYSCVPRLNIELIILTPKGILLTLRSIEPYKGEWHVPGGTVLFREKIKDTVARVAREELGVEVLIKKYLGYIEYESHEKIGYFGHSVGLAFLCGIKSEEICLNHAASRAGFFKKIPKNTLIDQKKFLSSLLNKKAYSAKTRRVILISS